tara:strand:- start:1388 stop:1849 length:462 start_codon:yes stop_codon:yes gene_type:complete
MSLERLKLLTTKTATLDKRSLGKAEITWEMVASALAHSDRLASLYTRVVYAHELSRANRLHREILYLILDEPDCQDWTIKISTLKELIWIAIMEEVTGRDFPVFDATGGKVQVLGISKRHWYTHLEPKYSFLKSLFGDWEQDVARTVGRQVKT